MLTPSQSKTILLFVATMQQGLLILNYLVVHKMEGQFSDVKALLQTAYTRGTKRGQDFYSSHAESDLWSVRPLNFVE